MSRSSAPVLTLLLPPLLLLLGAAGETTPDSSCSVKNCAALDVSLLQEFVSGLNVTSTTPDNETELAGLEPFGTLAEDWSRLLLLQRRQPEGTPLRENLLRLSRLMLAAYFEAEDREEQLKVQTNERRQATTSSPNPTTSEDQQASNITASPTVQKESTWINASGPYNNEDESSGNESTDGPSSEPALFNRTPSSADNETTPDNESAESLSSTQPSDSSLETSSPASNEVVHVHSEEEFRLQQIQAKAAAQNDESAAAATTDRVKSDESSGARKNLELDDGGNGTLSDEDSFAEEYNSTKSIEEYFAREDDSNATSSELFNSTESLELLKKSVDEFFANEEQQQLEATDGPVTVNSTDQLTESEEAFIAGMEEVNATTEESGLLDFYFPEDSHEAALLEEATESPSDEQQSTESSSDLKPENSASSESRTTTPTQPTPLNEPPLSPSNQDSNATLLSKNGSLDFPELISPESNSTEGKNDDNPTTTRTTATLVELISGGFSSTAYSNEITLESTSSPANGTEDRSEKYRDTGEATQIASSLPGNTTGKVEDGWELATESEAATTDPSLSDSATERPAEDNSKPTTEFAPSEPALDLEEVASPPAVRQARKILLTFQDGGSSEEPIAPNVLREPEVLSRRRPDTWQSKEGAFNPAMASLRNQWRQTRNGIAGSAAAGMNKRKSRERRIGEPALDAERQYRTFFAREPRRTQFAEKRSEEVQPRQ